MQSKIQIVQNSRQNILDNEKLNPFNMEETQKVNKFHRSFKEYTETPLVSLDNLAAKLGVKSIHIKDESFRFGLNAFKVLGSSYAIGRYIAKKLGIDINDLSADKILEDSIKEKLRGTTFVTATDGNHGRGVAWVANQLGLNSVVYMPKGSSTERLENIKALGSDASICDFNYDEAVRFASANANKFGWILMQDTSWEGYEEIPLWIMQGYTTMAFEAYKQLKELAPTHIFLQAGVGSMSAAVTAFFANVYKKNKPIITIVEPDKADCIYKTAKANDGRLHFVTGDLNSIMAGLCCGEPCKAAWDILKDNADFFVSVPDEITKKGMRLLAKPLGCDSPVVSGESGAVGLGFAAEILQNKSLSKLKEQLKLNEESRILCFSTEGATDKENYRKIIEKQEA